jgi:putative methylase
MMHSKKELAVTLSRLQSFEKPSWRLEQYSTDSEIAADIIWTAYHLGDITFRTIADLGCGTGIFGIGCMLFQPKKVFFIDIDEPAIKRLRENIKLMRPSAENEIICSDINSFNRKVDTVFQNPPFGVKNIHADKAFLEKAFEISTVIYSFHKINTKSFVEKISKDFKFEITHFFPFNFPLKRTQNYHTRNIQRIEVGCWRIKKSIT